MDKPINCLQCGKIISEYILNRELKTVTCPKCGSQRNWKDDKRKTNAETVQRYLRKDRGRKFT